MKKKVLVYSNRKADPCYWAATTPDEEARAFRRLFKILDQEWDAYAALKDESGRPDGGCPHRCDEHRGESPEVVQRSQARWDRQRALYLQAKAGDHPALVKLLQDRRHYEYEVWRFAEVETP